MTDVAAPPETHKLFIAGRWIDSTSGATFDSVNPADTRDVVGRFQQGTKADVAMAVMAAGKAFEDWRATPAPRRGELLYRFAALLADNKERLARAMTREMGKVLAEARGDVQEGIDIAFLMAGEGRRLFGDTVPSELPDKWAMSIRQPIGIAGIITPWNFPMAIPCWKMMPALVTGNTVVLKPSSDAPAVRHAARRAAGRGGLSAGRRQPGHRQRRGGRRRHRRQPRRPGHLVHGLVRDRPPPRRARGPAAQAPEPGAGRQERRRGHARRRPRPRGRRHHLVGVRDDRPAVHGVLAGHRRPAHRRGARRAARRSARSGLRLGSGLDETVDVGPLVNAGAVEKVGSYVAIGRGEGELVTGGERATGDELAHGHFFAPTVFAGVEPMSRIAQEEIFGPVLSVIPVDGYEAAVTAANQVRYGLSASIFTRDVNLAFRAMRDFETGIVYVNAGTTGAETHLPFGGWKETGNGHREAGRAALDTFTEWKSIYVDYSGRLQRAQIDNQPS